MLSAVTGWDVSKAELETTAERIVSAKKLFNVREGWTRAEDTLPKRFLSEALPEGASEGGRLSKADLDRMIARYYEARSWTRDGLVPPEVVERLDLRDLDPSPDPAPPSGDPTS